ncbi:MAG: S41 family peptidase [Candidatus Buchananbacteria bacterium]
MDKNKINLRARISLWLAIILIILAFSGGVFAGGTNIFNANNQGTIKGASAINSTNSQTSSGSLLVDNGKLPTYLTEDVDFNLFWEVWNAVKDNYYVKGVPDTQLFYGALAGIVNSLNDPYSVFFTPQGNSTFQQDLQGNFEGIGAEIAIKNNNVTIVSPLPDSPAFKAGLKPNDIILKVNGTSTQNMTVTDAVSLIRGPKGTKVTLSILRGTDSPADFTITRETINVKSVSLEYKGDIAYLKVRQFNDDTISLFENALNEINTKSSKGLIIDLRNNPGGYLQSAIDMVGELVGPQTAVIERKSDGTEIKHVSGQQIKLQNVPTVVLVDGGSASASEIVAGALQDYGKAKLVGEKTFGKGSVQDLITLSNGSAVKVTVAKWFTPKNRSIDQLGIEPDIKVDFTEEDFNQNKDPQLDRALQELNK